MEVEMEFKNQVAETAKDGFISDCDVLRGACKGVETSARNLMNSAVFNTEPKFTGQHNEVRMQVMLAVRHLEDARMRLGKAIQYSGDGVSIFDK